jgi:Tfp pilus assembly protein PilN
MKIQFNLLPENQKKHLHTQRVFRMAMEQEIQILIVCMILGLSLFGIFYILKTQVNILEKMKAQLVEQEAYEEIVEIQKTFKKVQTEMNAFSKLTNEHIRWSKALIVFSEIIPETIKVDRVSTEDNTMTIKAIADTREDVVDLKTIFKEYKQGDTPCFTNVIVPESELIIPVDVAFTMTFDIDVACLK